MGHNPLLCFYDHVRFDDQVRQVKVNCTKSNYQSKK